MLPKKVGDSLNKQIANEAYASSSYLSMASWCDKEGLRGCAGFFYQQSDEEREHMLKLVKYVNEVGGHAVVTEIKAPPSEYKSVKHVFEIALDQESEVTNQINKLVDLSFSAKDFASFNFLQWYVQEQVEEENLFRTILNIIKIAGDDEKALLFIDNEIANVRGKTEKKEN